MPKKQREGNVTRLDDYRQSPLTQRQEEVKVRITEILSRTNEMQPTAIVGLNILPSGVMETVIFGVEPEHVIPALTAMRGLMDKMEAYLTTAIVGRAALGVAIAISVALADSYAAPAVAALIMP